jgi:hypothetical protein
MAVCARTAADRRHLGKKSSAWSCSRPARFFAPADYRAGSDLFKRTCLLLDRILADIRVQEEMWRLGREAGRGK